MGQGKCLIYLFADKSNAFSFLFSAKKVIKTLTEEEQITLRKNTIYGRRKGIKESILYLPLIPMTKIWNVIRIIVDNVQNSAASKKVKKL